MPLGFQSTNHGTVAFGFFNIESDMLLLENYFFFADQFCRYIIDITEKNTPFDFISYWQVYCISTREDIGDLMGAIHGINYTGFIGELYKKYPFPNNPQLFKQNPYGINTQETVRLIVQKYARIEKISFVIDSRRNLVKIGIYHFSWKSFQNLIQYVWKGGYPRWKDNMRPDYVVEMKEKITNSSNEKFQDFIFEI